MRLIATSLLTVLALAPLSARADTWTIDTTDGSMTATDGSSATAIHGVTVANIGLMPGVREMKVLGDLLLLAGDTLEVKGTLPCRIYVGGDVLVEDHATLSASATLVAPGPGGGQRGVPSTPWSRGGFGGGGGGAAGILPGNATPGLPNGGVAGGGGGEGGYFACDGGNGGFGNFDRGNDGVSRTNSRLVGGPGGAARPGSGGLPGSAGANNPLSGGAGGAGGISGVLTVAPSALGGSAAGGAGGPFMLPGYPGASGGAGVAGLLGSQGGNGVAGLGGRNIATLYALAGGGGGGAGGEGGGGGGGTGGSSGGAGGGGGGHGGTPLPNGGVVQGGGGGGGGGAGAGGPGGNGGVGGSGGAGGHGAGALELVAYGRIDLLGLVEAAGQEGSDPHGGQPGIAGQVGGFGALGGAGTGSANGGAGGEGARGGDGGSAGNGGAGGGGAGGTISLLAPIVNIAGDISTPGGSSIGGAGTDGRLQTGHNASSDVVDPNAELDAVAIEVDAGSQTPRTTSLFTATSTPDLVPDSIDGTPLIGGAAPYGYLPVDVIDDPALDVALTGAPPTAAVAFVRYDTGPAQFDVDWEMRTSSTAVTRFDALVVINTTAAPLTGLRINGQKMHAFPVLDRAKLGGDNLPNLVDTLAPGEAYAILVPESSASFTADLTSLLPGVTNRVYTMANGQTDYFLVP